MKRLMTALFAAASAGLIASSVSASAQSGENRQSQLIIELSAPALSENQERLAVKGAQAAQFSVFDWGIGGLDEYSTPENAAAVFGERSEESFGKSENDVTYEYDWGSLDFHASKPENPPFLTSIAIKTSEVAALRGLRVDDSFDEALELFPESSEREFKGKNVLYCSGIHASADASGTPVPPCAVYGSNAGIQTLALAAPTEPLKDGDLLCADYYICTIHAVNGRITGINYCIAPGKELNQRLS